MEKPMTDLTINPEVARKILTGWIHAEITRAGMQRAVVGLSGGLDSALSCFLAAEALGPQNVLAVRMPYKNSSQDSLDDAQKVIGATGVQSATIEITPMVDPLFVPLPEMGNRPRGIMTASMPRIVPYDQSAAF